MTGRRDAGATELRAPRPVADTGPIDEVGTPTSPLDVGVPGWGAILRRSATRSKRDRIPMMAGSIAYHAFLSLFPAVIALIGLAQLVGLSHSAVTRLVDGIGRALPQGASAVLTDALTSAHHRTSGTLVATLVAVVVAVWSATSGMSVLQTGLDVAYQVPVDRSFLAQRTRAVPLLLLLATLGGPAAALIVFASPLGRVLQPHVGLPRAAFEVVWTVARWAVTVVVLLVLMGCLYRSGPNRRPPGWQWLSAGGLFATVVWLLASVALSFYVSDLGSYGRTYGALAGVAVLLLWLYATAYILLFGAELNAELERRVAAAGGDTGSVPPDPEPLRADTGLPA